MKSESICISSILEPASIPGRILVFIFASLFILFCGERATAQTIEDSVAVHARIEAYQKAWNTHEAAKVAGFFSPDADFIMGNLPLIHGREDIKRWWRAYFEKQEPGRKETFGINSIRIISDDVALVNLESNTWGSDNRGEKLLTRKARGTWLMRRQGNDWLIESMRGFPTEKDSVELVGSAKTVESLQPQIRALVRDYETMFNLHDPAAISAFYTEDANILIRNFPLIHGSKSIFDFWKRYFAESKSDKLVPENRYKSRRVIMIIDEIRMATADVGWINITVTAAEKPDLNQSPIKCSRATWVVIRTADEWKIAALWILPSLEDRIIRESDRFMKEQNKNLIYRECEEIGNKGNLDLIPQFYTEDFVGHFLPNGVQINGSVELKENIELQRKLIPDWTEKIELMISEGDLVAVWSKFSSSGTDGRFVSDIMSIYRFADGRIVEQWLLPDLASLIPQLEIEDDFLLDRHDVDIAPQTWEYDPKENASGVNSSKNLAMRANKEIWNKGNFQILNEIFTVDFVQHFLPSGSDIKGTEELRRHTEALFKGFPDWTETVNLIVAEGDYVMLQYTSTGTQTGQFMDIPPTGKKIQISEITIFRIAGGKIAEQWLLPDILSLNLQLGLTP